MSEGSAEHGRGSHEALVFGPQALGFDIAALGRLGSQLREKRNAWLLHTLCSLPPLWQPLVDHVERLRSVQGEKLLHQLNEALKTGIVETNFFPLPHVLLSPLVVASQLASYSQYSSRTRHGHSGESEDAASSNQTGEVLGLCTGALAAFAVGCSSSPSELEEYGSAAIRLAMAIGAVVDAQDVASDTRSRSACLSVSWTDTASRQAAEEVLKEYPQAYISVIVDQRRFTVTTAKVDLAALQHSFKAANISSTEIKLSGRFHWEGNQEVTRHLLDFVCADQRFQLPEAWSSVRPIRLETDGEVVRLGNLHEVAIQAILLDQSNWHKTFGSVDSGPLASSASKMICFASERCIPTTFAKKLDNRLEYVLGPSISIVSTPCDSTPNGNTPTRTGSEGTIGGSFSATNEYTSADALPDTRPSPDQRVAVVGMSIQAPGAKDLGEFWKVLLSGKSQHVEVPPERFPMHTPWRPLEPGRKWYGNFIEDYDKFDHKFFKKSPRELASTDPQQRLGLKLAYQAVQQSGHLNQTGDDKHIGCFVGIGNNDYERNTSCHPVNAFTAKGNVRAFNSGNISHYFGWTGPSLTLDTACSASAVAIHYACRSVLNGECTAALAGGVNVLANPDWFHNLGGASFLSPTGQCKPFDKDADGYCRGEGAGFVFLKALDRAIADGDQIFGVIAGTRVYQNQNCTAITVPNSPSLSHLFKDVLSQSKLDPSAVSLVEAHGTGTAVGDPAEYEAVRLAFATRTRQKILHLTSVKGSIGHCEVASGVMSLLKILLMLQHGTITPQASFSTINPSLKASPHDNISIPLSTKPWDVDFRAALINNYGASGSNASMVITEAPENTSRNCNSPASLQPPSTKFPVWLCGLDEGSLEAYSAKLTNFLQEMQGAGKQVTMRDLSFNLFRQSNRALSYSMIFNATSPEHLQQQLLDSNSKKGGLVPIPRRAARPVILCFGGQISTYVGLDQAIYDQVARFRYHIDRCDAMCLSLGLSSIIPEIFQRSPLEDIVKLQCALFAMQYACAMTWIDCGAQVAAVVGHSFGELAGMCVAGVYSLKEALHLVSGRAEVVRRCWGKDRGSMLAVEGSSEEVARLIQRAQAVSGSTNDPCIACYNGPRSFTIGGSEEAIATTMGHLQIDTDFARLKVKKLNVTNAFHSALVDPLRRELEQLGQAINFSTSKIRVERATEHASEPITKSFIFEHMRRPVFFNAAVQRLARDYPASVWVEAGSNSTVTVMASRALAETQTKSLHFEALNLNSPNSFDSLVNSSISLWRQGLDVVFWPHHKSQTSEYSPLVLPPYQFTEASYWTELKSPPKSEGDVQAVPDKGATGLTEFLGWQNREKSSARFKVNTDLDDFQQLVKATLVAGVAIAPSSMLQLNIVLNAIGHLQDEFDHLKSVPEFRNVQHNSILAISAGKTIYLDVTSQDPNRLVWEWKLGSENRDKNYTTHTTGLATFASLKGRTVSTDFDILERLVDTDECAALLNDPDADEIVQGRSIYRTFEPVVSWGAVYQCVTKLAMKKNKTAAVVKGTYNVNNLLDAVISECFCQVASFHNNLASSESDIIHLRTKIGRWLRNPEFNSLAAKTNIWHVLVKHQKVSETTITSDVFAFDAQSGVLMEVILGLSYQRTPIEGIRAVLAGAAQKIIAETQVPLEAKPAYAESAPVVQSHIPTLLSEPIREADVTAQAKPTTTAAVRPDITSQTRDILCNLSGLETHEVQDDADLIELGVDSLMGMELAREIETAFKCTLSTDQLVDLTDFRSLVACISSTLGYGDSINLDADTSRELQDGRADTAGSSPVQALHGGADVHSSDRAMESHRHHSEPGNGEQYSQAALSVQPVDLDEQVVIDTFQALKWGTDDAVKRTKFEGYLNRTVPRSTELCVAFISHAFEQLGCLVRSAGPGQRLQRISHSPQHAKYVEVLYNILEHDARLIDIEGGEIVRTTVALPKKSTDLLLADLLTREPGYASEHQLVALLGPRLAGILGGKERGVQVLFSEGKNFLADFYAKSIFNSIWISQLEHFLQQIFQRLGRSDQVINVLEVGAGTGGTTKDLVAMIARLGFRVKFTMTDISSSLVAQARRQFKQCPFMDFQVLDIESEPAQELLQSQHIVLSTNCIHATRRLASSLTNIHKLLRPDGFLILVEMTRSHPWLDFIFGTVEGWWAFEDDRQHALSSAEHWRKVMQSSGYAHVDWTEGDVPESNIQQLIIAHASGPVYSRRPQASAPVVVPDYSGDTVARQATLTSYIDKHMKEWAPKPRGTASATDGRTVSRCVLVTGATGSLGAHIVAELSQQADVSRVVCLNRHSSIEAETRQHSSFEKRGIKLGPAALPKLTVVAADTSKPLFGLAQDRYDWLVQNVTDIIHSAWPMSLTRPLSGYEIQFRILRNLIDLATDASSHMVGPNKFGFVFVSSIAVVALYPYWTGRAYVPEEPAVIKSIPQGGYPEAKATCEAILERTLYQHPDQFHAKVTRIAQISGSSASGYWNPTEYMPILAKSSQVLRQLPDLDGTFSWSPVDQVAASLSELMTTESATDLVYHIDNPSRQPWKELIALFARLLRVPKQNLVSIKEWTTRVRRFRSSAEDNPALQLAEYFDTHFEPMSCGDLVLDVSKATKHSKTLRDMEVISLELLNRYVDSWKESGFLDP